LPPPACTAFRSLSLPKCASLRKHRNGGRARKTNKWRAILLLCYHAFLKFLESALKVVIVGAGIGGLTLALMLHKEGIDCELYESVREIKPLGVGINLLPHAVATLEPLDVVDTLRQNAIETSALHYYN